MIQIVVHQFVRKMSAKKNSCLKKNGPPLSPGMWEYVESVLRRKKLIPYKPYVCGKHVQSILGTCKNMTKKVFNLNNMDIQPPGTNSYFKYEFVPATPTTAVGETRQPT